MLDYQFAMTQMTEEVHLLGHNVTDCFVLEHSRREKKNPREDKKFLGSVCFVIFQSCVLGIAWQYVFNVIYSIVKHWKDKEALLRDCMCQASTDYPCC